MEPDRIDRKAMKLDAKAAMQTHKPSVYLVAIVFLLISFVLGSLSAKLQFPHLSVEEIIRWSYDEDQIMRLWQATASRSGTSRLLDVAITLMTVMLTGGFSLFCLHVSRREAAGVGTLFDLFGYFFRFLWLEIVTGFLIFFWSLLLVVPGIIAAYRYAMAPFIFFDNPEKGAMQCIRESKAMMRGKKGALFVLDLSFIGWAILSAIPFVSIYTTPYIYITKANFYRAVSWSYSAEQQRQQQQQYYGDPWAQ